MAPRASTKAEHNTRGVRRQSATLAQPRKSVRGVSMSIRIDDIAQQSPRCTPSTGPYRACIRRPNRDHSRQSRPSKRVSVSESSCMPIAVANCFAAVAPELGAQVSFAMTRIKPGHLCSAFLIPHHRLESDLFRLPKMAFAVATSWTMESELSSLSVDQSASSLMESGCQGRSSPLRLKTQQRPPSMLRGTSREEGEVIQIASWR